MANIDNITAPIDEYLLSIAESLQRVQSQLNDSKVLSVDGQSYTTYQLPKLEFEMKMSIQLETITEGDQTRSVFKAVPVDAGPGTKTTSGVTEASVIKGAFLAVPSDLGKPPPINRTFVQKLASGDYNVIINVQSAIGEPQAGITVQYNIDRQLSDELTEAEIDWSKIYFDHAQVQTNAEGNAYSKLTIDIKKETKIAVIVDVLGKTETIVIVGKSTRKTVSAAEADEKAKEMLDKIMKQGFPFSGLFGQPR